MLAFPTDFKIGGVAFVTPWTHPVRFPCVRRILKLFLLQLCKAWRPQSSAHTLPRDEKQPQKTKDGGYNAKIRWLSQYSGQYTRK